MTTQNINKEQFEKEIQGRRPVLVEFWAPWCVYCRRLGPAYDQIGQQRGSELAVVKINIDEESAPLPHPPGLQYPALRQC